jgi:hypothetical protein
VEEFLLVFPLNRKLSVLQHSTRFYSCLADINYTFSGNKLPTTREAANDMVSNETVKVKVKVTL